MGIVKQILLTWTSPKMTETHDDSVEWNCQLVGLLVAQMHMTAFEQWQEEI